MKFLMMMALLLPFTVSAKPAVEILDHHYGDHDRQVFDLWLPKQKRNKKAPLVIFIHGGGWSVGSKDEFRKQQKLIRKYNREGIAVAAINYRFLKHAPLQTIMREDIAGFVQFMRYHANFYNIDPTLIMPYGVSAGGSASLWLATHDDIADPNAEDPIKRMSSRVTAAGHVNAQVSYDYFVWYQFFGKEITDHFMKDQVWSRYHFDSFEDLQTERGKAVRKDLDMFGNMDAGDAPILFWSSLDDDPTRDANHFIHSPNHARLLSDRAHTVGLNVETYVRADGTILKDPHKTLFDYFTRKIEEIKDGKVAFSPETFFKKAGFQPTYTFHHYRNYRISGAELKKRLYAHAQHRRKHHHNQHGHHKEHEHIHDDSVFVSKTRNKEDKVDFASKMN